MISKVSNFRLYNILMLIITFNNFATRTRNGYVRWKRQIVGQLLGTIPGGLCPRRIRRCPPDSASVRLSPPGSPPRILSWRTLADFPADQKVRQSFPPRIRRGLLVRELADFLPGGHCPPRTKFAAEKSPPRTLFAADKVRRGKKSAANIVRQSLRG